jgi:ribosomal protein S1
MRIAASPPSSARASKKSSGKVDIFKILKLSREKKRVLTPQRKTTDPQEGKERNSKDYDLCNTGKPINGGVCE